MNPPIWRLAGFGLLCLSLSAHTLADDNDPRGQQNRPEGGGQNPRAQQQQIQQQMQHQQQEQRGQQQQMQQQMQQQQRAQQQELRGQQQEQRGQQQQQQQQQQPATWQQRQQEFNQRQTERLNEQQNPLQQNRPQGPNAAQLNDNRPQPGRQDNGGRRDDLPIQGKPGVVYQTQPPIRGNNEGPRGNYAPGRPDDRRDDHRGNGWGPGPQYRPGYTVDRFPDREYRVPYRGQDFFYSGGYWYRPQGPRYVVVAPPYGIRTRALPDYATRMWIGGGVFFLAAGTYYQYMDNTQDYVVVNPPQGVVASQPQPAQGDNLEVAFYPANGQGPSQMEQDRYDCQRYAAQQSGFDPATATYAPADSVAYLYRQNMGNCLVSRGYQVN